MYELPGEFSAILAHLGVIQRKDWYPLVVTAVPVEEDVCAAHQVCVLPVLVPMSKQR